MDILQWIANANLLGNQWNILAVLGCMFVWLFTFRKLTEFHKYKRIFITTVCVIAFIDVIELCSYPVFFMIHGITSWSITTFLISKAEQIFTMVSSFTLVWYTVKNKLRIRSYLTLIGLSYQFAINVPIVVATKVPSYRILPEPQSSFFYWTLYIPSYTMWIIAYLGVWKRERASK